MLSHDEKGSIREVTQRDIDAFRRFLVHLHGNAELEVMLLKAHLPIEEQLRAVIQERIRGHMALGMDESRWTFDLIARLAEALCFGEEDESLWQGARKSNRIRNTLAHNVEPRGLSDQIDDLNRSWPSRLADSNQTKHLFLTLCSIFASVSGLVRGSSTEASEPEE
jgi:predicted RNA-binding protein with PUA domain